MSFDLKIQSLDGAFYLLEHDIIFDNLGASELVTGVQKLEQDILKILFTYVNYFYKNYGNQLEQIIGTNLGLSATKTTLAKQVQNSISYLQQLQTAQSKYQQIDASELISNIVNIDVDYLGEIDNTVPSNNVTFSVTISVLNAAGEVVVVNRNISVMQGGSA